MVVRYGGRVADASTAATRDLPTARVPPVSRRARAIALGTAVLTATAATLCPAAHAGAATVHLTVALAPTAFAQSQSALDRWHTSPMVIANSQTPTAMDAHGTSYLRSVNWAGYVVSGGIGSFRSAQASFVVPKLLSCGPSEDSDSSYWAGLDGAGSQTVEQEGVDSACLNGAVYYIPWYEMYPGDTVEYANMVVRGGDSIVATTTYESGGRYVLNVADSTNRTSATATITDPGLENISAECIAEDPGMAPQAPYANYGSVTFSGCMVNGVPIGTLSPDAIDMVNSQGEVDASTTTLTDSTSFMVTQVTPAPTPTPPTPTPPVPVVSFLLPAVGMASTPSGSGYWLTDRRGAVSAHGGAQYHGSMATVVLNSPIAHIVSTSDGNGYWLVAADGGTFAFGDAGFYGSMAGQHLDAPFHGSTGALSLNRPIVSMASSADGSGYWFVASDGGIFAFDVPFYGSEGAHPIPAPVVGMAGDGGTGGYWMVGADGTVYGFNAPDLGSG